MKIALVHEWLVDIGGSEKCVQEFHALYPNAPLHTLFYLSETVRKLGFEPGQVHGSILQSWRQVRNDYRKYLPLFPFAIEQFDLSGYDVIVSSSHCVAKGVLTRGDQLHVCYCHTPARYVWDLTHRYLRDNHLDRGLKSTLARLILHYVRLWDVQSSNRVDQFIANSCYTAARIWRT
ncbi:MAG: glycosyltransferase family 4 protein, partial [Syntrophomonadaceae bacterium]|nr:glycosyltransferase family 4 protein [Syntrophomonadaceae bacterium]